MTDKFQNLGKKVDSHIQEAKETPNKTNIKKSILRHVNIKLSKNKDRENFESSTRKAICHVQGNPHKNIRFSSETLKDIRK